VKWGFRMWLYFVLAWLGLLAFTTIRNTLNRMG
jgi:hypothetical protein